MVSAKASLLETPCFQALQEQFSSSRRTSTPTVSTRRPASTATGCQRHISPTKVVRVAIQNAASVAALLITTEAMVAEVPKKNAGGGMPAGGGGMGGMGGMDF